MDETEICDTLVEMGTGAAGIEALYGKRLVATLMVRAYEALS